MDSLMIIHTGLQLKLEQHTDYGFITTHSRALIYGAADLAAIHLIILRFT